MLEKETEQKPVFSEQTGFLLQERNMADQFASSEMQRIALLLNTQPDEAGLTDNPLRCAILMSLALIQLTLMRQVLQSEELMWYETHKDNAVYMDEPADISSALRRFDGQVEILTNGILKTECGRISSTVCTKMPAERLIFVMLNLLADMMRDEPEFRVFRMEAEQDMQEIRVVMSFRRPEEGECEPLPVSQMLVQPPECESPASAANLVKRFCEVFHVRMMRRNTETTRQIVLSFAETPLHTAPLALCSDHTPYHGGGFTAYHAILARAVPVEVLIGCEERFF